MLHPNTTFRINSAKTGHCLPLGGKKFLYKNGKTVHSVFSYRLTLTLLITDQNRPDSEVGNLFLYFTKKKSKSIRHLSSEKNGSTFFEVVQSGNPICKCSNFKTPIGFISMTRRNWTEFFSVLERSQRAP